MYDVRPSYYVPHGDELLSVKELAGALKRTERYVRAMIRDGFLMPGWRATINQALRWLAENPGFRQNRPQKTALKK